MNEFVGAAFGDNPGCWPLPSPVTPREFWWCAVAAGGQGRYGRALTYLDALDRHRGEPAMASLSASTRASFLRQLGGHTLARRWDGRAWALAGDDVDAGTDSLVGLAADALGVGRFAVSRRLLRRADEVLGGNTSGRLPVRLAWVNAELAMATGAGGASVEHAKRGVDLAGGIDSARHAVKSQVVLAAALCSVGDLGASRRVADAALASTDRLGLVPLRWALACLLVGIGSSVHPPPRLLAIRDAAADIVRHRGGTWTAR